MTTERWRIGAVMAAVVAFVLGVIGLAWYLPGPQRLLDLAYNALQLFVLSSEPLSKGSPYNWPLEIARFLAPATTAYAVFEALRALMSDELRRRRTARSQGHAVVCGDQDAARELARNLHATGRAVVLVRSGRPQQPGREAIPIVIGDPREGSTLQAAGISRASQLYACADQSATNAAIVLAAQQLHDHRRGRLTAFAQVHNDDLVESLRVQQIATQGRQGVTVDFFALDDTAARLLLDQHPPAETASPVVVIGFGAFGRALVRALVRQPSSDGHRRTVLVRGDRSAVADTARRIDAVGRGATVDTLAEQDPLPDATTGVYVCLDDEDAAVATALRLAREPGRGVVACLRRAAPFEHALGDDLAVFGILDAACRAEAIAEASTIERFARAVHDHYVQMCLRRGDTPSTNASLVPWRDLPTHLRQSNYAQVEHIGAKLKEIGAAPATTQPAEPFVFQDGEVQRLARAEHRRWMNERLANGFVYGPRRQGREHPDLVDWSDLSQESRQKDIDTIEHLPALLAGAGLYLHRLPATGR